MNTTFFIAVLLNILITCFAAVSMGFFKDPKHPGKCAIRADLILLPGEHKDPDIRCGRIVCGTDSSAEFQTCGIQVPPPGCSFGDYKDAGRKYPECCGLEFKC